MMRCILLSVFIMSSLFAQTQTNLDSLYVIWEDDTQTVANRAKAYNAYVYYGYLFSQPDSAFMLLENLIDFAKAHEDPSFEALAYNTQGESLSLQGEPSKALNNYNKAMQIYKSSEDVWGMANSLINIGNIYIDQADYPKALEFFKQSLENYQQINFKKGIANSLSNIGLVYDYQGDYTQALDYYNQSLKLNQELNDKQGIASSLGNIGIVNELQGNYPEALDFHFKSLKIYEALNDQKGIANTLNNVGLIHDYQGNYEDALEYHQRSIKITKELGDKRSVSMSQVNIGIIHYKQKRYQEALDNFQQSIKIQEELGDKWVVSNACNNIGNVYFDQGKFDQSIDYFNRSLVIDKEIGNINGAATTLRNIGMVYLEQGRYNVAIKKCKESLKISEENGFIYDQQAACADIYAAYKAIGNSKEALKYHEKMSVIADSLFNEDNTKKLTQLEMQYEFDKQEEAAKLEQEKKDAIAAQQLKQRKLERNGFIAGFGVVLLFAGIFFRQRNRINKEKERSDELLLNILPEEVAEELKNNGHSDAQLIDHVTVLFTDFKDFTKLSEQLTPNELVADLHACFSAFDRICEKNNVEKIKTIGDAYMAAGGLPFPNTTHAKDVVNATLEMAEVVEKIKEEKTALNQAYFEVRIGVHTGPVVAGIVGVKKFQYDIWGDTVNTASRIESNGEAGKVNISQVTYEMLKDDPDFVFEHRGKIEAKGKGEMDMWFVSKN